MGNKAFTVSVSASSHNIFFFYLLFGGEKNGCSLFIYLEGSGIGSYVTDTFMDVFQQLDCHQLGS